ncbi:MAG TPA: pentapeptide repeat-containing protein [Ktedonosporobacter sp.]|nr:pentapeptide repeat-containing protein [Ktedonosporobacter sp.]
MCWLKRNLWKTGIALAGMLLLLVLMVWIPVTPVGAYEGVSGLAGPVTATVQATPTEDATVTALNKEKLQHENDWLWSYGATILSSFISALVLVIGVLIGFWQWLMNRNDTQNKESQDRQAAQVNELKDRQTEREKREEELFQTAVTGLGDEREGAKIGAAILLRSFLRPRSERYYIQIFDLVAANLRLPRTPHSPKDPNTGTPNPPEALTAPLPSTALSHALIVAFMEAFPRAREQALEQEKRTSAANPAYKNYKVVRSSHGHVPVIIPLKEIQSLSARGINLDNGYLWYADLKQVWMAEAFLRKTDLMRANLSEANLYGAHLEGAYLWETKLSGANLWMAHLCNADLNGTDLSRAILLEANLSRASLQHVDLREANLREANLDGAKLVEADLSGSNLEDALSLKDTELHAVIGLTDKQKKACKAKGAIIIEAPPTNPPQSTVAPSPPEPRHDALAPSAPPIQESTPTPDTDGNSITSSQPSAES